MAVLIASHNRASHTLACLAALFGQVQSRARITVHLVDDGSTDGTPELVAGQYEGVQLQRGTGELYWAAAMALAEGAAAKADPDFFLWLNDDTVMDPDCLALLLKVHDEHPDAIVVAATRDPGTGQLTYGGRVLLAAHPQRFRQLPVSTEVQACDTFNGNCVLVPRSAHLRVGMIDGSFPHAYADDDYGLRARSAGVPVLQAPGTLATCTDHKRGPLPPGLGARWRYLQSPKGLPVSAQLRYLRRHGDWRWPYWLVAGTAKRLAGR